MMLKSLPFLYTPTGMHTRNGLRRILALGVAALLNVGLSVCINPEYTDGFFNNMALGQFARFWEAQYFAAPVNATVPTNFLLRFSGSPNVYQLGLCERANVANCLAYGSCFFSNWPYRKRDFPFSRDCTLVIGCSESAVWSVVGNSSNGLPKRLHGLWWQNG